MTSPEVLHIPHSTYSASGLSTFIEHIDINQYLIHYL